MSVGEPSIFKRSPPPLFFTPALKSNLIGLRQIEYHVNMQRPFDLELTSSQHFILIHAKSN